MNETAVFAVYLFTERSEMLKAIPEVSELRSRAIEAYGNPLFIVNQEREIIDWNSAFHRMVEKTPDQIRGRKCCEVLSGFPEHRCLIGKMMSGETCRREFSLQTADADRRLHVIIDKIATDGTVAFLHTVVDITSHHNKAFRDELTGLYNYGYLMEALRAELHRAKRRNQTLGVVMIDLDFSKSFNDAFGHPAGNVLLENLGRLLKESVRQEDIACRYGGDEFALVIPDASQEVVVSRVEKIRRAVEKLRIVWDGQALPSPTISSGVAMFPLHGDFPQALLEAADRALYRAKREGRNRTCVAEENGGI